MKKLFVFFLHLLLLFQTGLCQAGPAFLNAEEQEWLNKHKVITVGADPKSPPIEFIDDQGVYRGMSADYLARIEKMLGVKFKIISGQNWAMLMEMAQQKKVDMLPAIVSSHKRRKFLLFTKPWITVPGVVISTNQCGSINDLANKKVAVVNGSIWDDYLSTHPTNIELVRVEDLRTAFEFMAMSGVYAVVANMAAATEMIHEMGLSNLRVVLRLEQQTEISFGIREDWPIFVSILDKTLDNISPAVKEKIRDRWLTIDSTHWWWNSSVQRIAFFIVGGLLLIIAFFITWNRILKKQVQQRSRALEQAHRHLIRAAKMESVGQLAAGVAHEVKNPLAIISMGLEYMAAGPDRDPTEQEILADMDDAVQRADKVIRGLLDYSHYSKLERKPGDYNTVIEKSLHLVDHEFNKRNIKVRTELGSLTTAYFDFNRMQQVLINLFMNSIQAMENGGSLRIVSQMHLLSPAEAEFSTTFTAGMEIIRVTVSDTGPGIGAGDNERIFDPFYTTKDIGQGTGLGLSESRNIMELHNGTLHLTNCTTTGACAVLMLPCTQGEEYEEENSAS